MQLTLGPENLQCTFHFEIEEANKRKPKFFDNLGIYFSGGIDSTALLLLILTELRNTNRLGILPVTCYTIIKQDFASRTVVPLLELFKEKFQIDIKHNNNILNHNNDLYNIRPSLCLDLYLEHKTTIFFSGNNKMPPENLVIFKNKLNADYGYEKDKILFYTPFLYMHKPQILDIFYQLDGEEILSSTYSCTMESPIPCRKCYACEERAWGFEMLKKQDPLLAQNRLTE